MSVGGADPPIRVLLIGIDRYLPPRDPRTPRYGSLHGCVRDVERLERWFRRTLGVPQERIRRLVAPHDAEPPPFERRREWPGYEGLVAAFERLIDEARPGEHLWIHYAGHGGRTPTLVPEQKGPLGLDECLVPWDVGDPGARYLRDVELAVLLERMERAGLFATVVLDCCHSGGATRRGTRVRGVDAVDRTPRPEESLVAPRERLAASGRRPSAAWRHAQLPAGRPFDPTGYVLLAACRPGERSVEERSDDGDPGGAFTRSLLRTLGGMDRGDTYTQLFVAAGQDVRSRFPAQTPVIEGEGERPLLGGRELPRPRGVAVLGEGREPGTVRIATGRVHGVVPGTRFAIEPPALVPSDAVGPARVMVEVTAAGAVVCEACRVGRSVDAAERPAADAAAGPGARRLVCIAEAEAAGPLAGDRAVLLPETAGRRGHLERWQRLARLENREPGAFLRGRLEATLERLPGGWRPGAPMRSEPFEPGSGAPEVEAGAWVLLKITNANPEELNVAVLDLRPDQSVAQVFPAWRGGWFQPVDPDRGLPIPLRAWLPEGMAEGTDILLVLATTGPVSHRWLEMGPLEAAAGEDAPMARARACAARRLTALAARTDSSALDDGGDGWTTSRVALKILRGGSRPEAESQPSPAD